MDFDSGSPDPAASLSPSEPALTARARSAPDPASTAPPPVPPDAQAPVSEAFRARSELWLEVMVVIALAVLPHTIQSVAMLFDSSQPEQAATPFLQLTSILCRTVGVVVPFWFLMRRSGASVMDFGLRRFSALQTLVGGTVLWGVASYAPLLVSWPVYWWLAAWGVESVDADFTGHWAAPTGVGGWVCIVMVGLLNGFGEEIVVRGYLITRLAGLWSSRTAAVVVTSVLFGSYHLYYGWYPALHITLMGLVLGGFFAATRCLWPVIFAHVLGDVMPFVFYAME